MNQNVKPNKTNKKIHFELMPDTGTLSYDDSKKYFSRFGISIFAYFVITLLIQVALTVICLFFVPERILTHGIWGTIINYGISFVVSYGIGIPIFLKFASPLPDAKLLRQKMKAGHVIAGLSISIFVMLAGNYVSQVVIRFLEGVKGGTISNPVEEMTSGTPWWLNLIFIAIAAPIFEELFFRKVLCKHLLPLGEGWAIFLSAAVFGFAHGNFSQFFYAFALGAFFAFIYIKTGKLIYSVFYHMFINVLGGVVSPYLLERYYNTDLEWLESAATDAELLAQNPEAYADMIVTSMLMLLYSTVLYGLAIAGAIIFFKAIKRKKFSADGGLLPPVKKGKASALMLNVGVALSIAYFTFNFVISLI